MNDTVSDPRLIVPLDVPTVAEARAAIEEIGDAVTFYKIGHQLAYAPEAENGFHLAHELIEEGKQVFLDLKILDIDNTVAKAVENIAKMDMTMLTVHAYPNAMHAAISALKGAPLTLLAVTVLTSMDDADLVDAGYAHTAEELVKLRAEQALAAGMGGIVSSAQEAETVSKIIGPDMALVTPGIRPEGADHGDQKRVMTPSKALAAGATHLVVGRPIMAASNRRAAALAIVEEMKNT